MKKSSLVPSNFSNEREPFKTFPHEMDRFLDDLWKSSLFRKFLSPFDIEKTTFPDIDVVENEKEFQVMAELPGLGEKDIKIDLHNNILVLSGEKKIEKEDIGNNYYINERCAGSFYRTVQIPVAIDENKIEAKMKNGVLKITLPKSAEALARVRRIKVEKA